MSQVSQSFYCHFCQSTFPWLSTNAMETLCNVRTGKKSAADPFLMIGWWVGNHNMPFKKSVVLSEHCFFWSDMNFNSPLCWIQSHHRHYVMREKVKACLQSVLHVSNVSHVIWRGFFQHLSAQDELFSARLKKCTREGDKKSMWNIP